MLALTSAIIAGPCGQHTDAIFGPAEETGEVLAADDADRPEELADVLEVVLALASDLGLDAARLEEVRQAKAAERGGFAERIVWFGISGE